MKRDARIGLAVILVLGLFATLLIGRALYKHSEPVAKVEDDARPAEAAAPVSNPVDRVNGAPVVEHTDDAVGSPLNTFKLDHSRPLDGGPVVEAAPVVSDVALKNPKPVAGEPGDADHGAPKKESVAPASSGFAYTVAASDNIHKISTKLYGDGKYAKNILAANPGLQEKKLLAGKVIRVPEVAGAPLQVKLPAFGVKTEAAPAKIAPKVLAADAKTAKSEKTDKAEKSAPAIGASSKPEASSGKAETHKVQSGETLGTIAKQYYGSGGAKSVARIVAANKGLDPNKLKIGQEISIPAK
jgi:nucleoid-associated protein YgaU